MRRVLVCMLVCGSLAASAAAGPTSGAAAGGPPGVGILAGGGAVAAGPAATGVAKFRPGTSGTPYVAGEILVRFRPGVSRLQARSVNAELGAVSASRIPSFGVDVVRLPAGQEVEDALEAYRADPRVELAEPNLVRRLLQTPPDDPLFAELWGLHNTGQAHGISDSPPPTAAGTVDADIDALEAWETQAGQPGTVIAVLDSGVDINHPDLADSLWVNAEEIAGNGIDDDGNGYVDDVHGYDFVHDDPDPEDTTPHGTHVAGIIAAQRNNGIGGAGVCPECTIMALKIGDGNEVFLDEMLEAIAYAIDMGAHVINGSFGGGPWSRLERDAFEAAGDAGILSVLAAGNARADNDLALASEDGFLASPSFPASYTLPTILAVAASNHRDEYGYFTGCVLQGEMKRECAFTNWGRDSVDVAAPGVDVLSTLPGGALGVFNGTSMATPHVAGVAGLVKSQHPGYTPVQVKNAIMNSANRPSTLRALDVLATGPSGGSFSRTNGRVNANAALTGDPNKNATPLTDGNIDGATFLPKMRTGWVSWPGDVNDVYRKRLIKGKVYRFTLDGPPGRDFDLWVWKPGTTEIWQFEPGCLGLLGACKIRASSLGPTADETVQFKVFSTGRYHIQVTAFFSAGKYTLKVTKT